MTETYHEDRSFDYTPEIEDWSIKGEQEDKERWEQSLILHRQQEDYEDAMIKAEHREYLKWESCVQSTIQNLNALKGKLYLLLKEIQETEGGLINAYSQIWAEDEDYWGDHYCTCDTEEEKIIADLQRIMEYEVITDWINQYKPIRDKIDRQSKLQENTEDDSIIF